MWNRGTDCFLGLWEVNLGGEVRCDYGLEEGDEGDDGGSGEGEGREDGD